MWTKPDYIAEIKSKAKDAAGKLVDPDDWDAILREALREYSFHRPWYITEEITASGLNGFLLVGGLANWLPDFSEIKYIEYPAGNTTPSILTHKDWFLYNDGTKIDGSNVKLIFLSSVPKNGEKFIVSYKTVRNISDDTDGVSFPQTPEHFVNITTLGAVHACRRLAGAFAQSMDASIGADVVNYNDQSSKYIRLANQYREQYNLAVFATKGGEPAVHGAFNLQSLTRESDSDPSGRFLFHRTRG